MINNPNSFFVLWTLERCKWLQKIGDHGPLEVIFGGPHISQPSIASVALGDVIYPVCVKQGGLYILASLTMEQLISPRSYMQSRFAIDVPNGKTWGMLFCELQQTHPAIGHRMPITCCDQAAVGGNGSAIRFDRKLPAELLSVITLGPKLGREQPLKGVRDGLLTHNFSLHGHVRRLSHASAALLTNFTHE